MRIIKSLVPILLVLVTTATQVTPALAQSTTAGSTAVPAAPVKVVQKVLDNGLQVLVAPKPGSGSAIVDVFVNVGSLNETAKNNGISHFFEHMVFKGTDKRPVGAIDKEVDGMGADNNARTGYDTTDYYIEAPSDKIDEAIDVLADMTYNAGFPQDEITKEKQVVLRERDQRDDDPSQSIWYHFAQLYFGQHPYAMPIIGTAEGLDPQTQQDFKAWRDTYYVPNNMTVVVAGDVDPDAVIKTVSEKFAGKTAKDLPKLDVPQVASVDKPNVQEMVRDFEQGYLMMGWPAPSAKEAKDSYALDVLARVLSGGRNSSFYQNIYKKLNLVNSISADNNTLKDAGVFTVNAEFPYANRAALEQAILGELERAVAGKITPEEVERAKTILVSNVALMNETNSGLADTLGTAATVNGDYKLGLAYADNIRAVTLDDVVAVARKYIDPQKYVELVFVPKNAKTASLAPAANGIYTETLANGLQVILQPDTNTDVVAFHTMARAGRIAESADQAGITTLLQQLLQRGTTSRTEEEIFSALEDLGAKVGGQVVADGGDLSLVATHDTWQQALPIYLDVLLNPAFKTEVFNRLKDDMLKQITASNDDLWTVTVNNFRKTLFGPGGYGNADMGTADTVGKLTLDDVKAFYQKYYAPNNLVVSVAGNFDPEVMMARLRAGLGSVPAGQPVDRTWPELSVAANQTVTTTRNANATYMLIAFPAPAVSSPDFAATKLLSNILGGGMSSRFFVDIREKQGLAYSTGAIYGPRAGQTALAAYFIGQPENAQAAHDAILKILEDIKANGVTDEELARAKSKELGSFLLGHETANARAFNQAMNAAMNLPLAYDSQYPDLIKAVTKEDIQRVAEKYLKNYVVSQLDPAPK